ncbi:inactive purple acid phosphatase 29 isoform X2 [Tripterygium wilfordii]|uniref:Inactive purple acid phosphatase 29 isoform X2 n=1 Tax=Tripterygium wilfordii TaxID=458696 RepID=A0A7J7CH67_TRIWF|nr:inactive purple acid phosphatase 29 isoform X2 [Tripterygium wilfordii]
MSSSASNIEMLTVFVVVFLLSGAQASKEPQRKLQFGENREFKILQVADMHYGDGKTTPCVNLTPIQEAAPCSDLNTTAFLGHLIQAEKPHLIVFTGDNIYRQDVVDAAKSMNAACAPAIESNIPWAAVLENHDQESNLSREKVMKHIVTLKNTWSQVNPLDAKGIDGFVEIIPMKPLKVYMHGSKNLSKFGFKAHLKSSKKEYTAPGLAYFHIPLPEFKSFDSSNATGERQEGTDSLKVNSSSAMVVVLDIMAMVRLDGQESEGGDSIFEEKSGWILGRCQINQNMEVPG